MKNHYKQPVISQKMMLREMLRKIVRKMAQSLCIVALLLVQCFAAAHVHADDLHEHSDTLIHQCSSCILEDQLSAAVIYVATVFSDNTLRVHLVFNERVVFFSSQYQPYLSRAPPF